MANFTNNFGKISAITTTTLKVVFNQPVDTTKAALKIKMGAAIYGSTVAWNETKDTATLTSIVKLPANDYTLEVSGLTTTPLTKAFTVAAEAPAKVEILSSTVNLSGTSKVAFKVSNQYGEDMKVAGTAVVSSAYNTTLKADSDVVLNGNADSTLTFTSAKSKVGDVVRVTLTYAGITAQANLTVVDVPSNASISFGAISPLKDTARITVGDTGLVIPYNITDQYGTAAKLSAYTADTDKVVDKETIDGVQFVSSNPAVVDVDTFAVDVNGKLTFTAGATAGTAVITAVINASGAVASFPVTVNAASVVDTLAISTPTALIAANESVSLNVTAADQYGVAVAAKDIAVGTITSSNTAVVPSAAIASGKLTFTAGATAGTATISVNNAANTKVIGTVAVVVEPAAKAAQISSVSFAPKFEVGATKTMTAKDFVVLDQYGRVIPNDNVGLTFAVAKKDATATIFGLTDKAFTAGSTAGSEVFTLTATFGGATTPAYEFTVSAIASSDITSYAITAVPTMYASNDANYAKTLELTGKTATGDVVVLAANKVTYATTSNADVATVTNAGVVTGVAKGTAVIALWNGAAKLAETTVTVSDVKPVVTSVKFDDKVETTIALNANLLDNLEVLDQYGVKVSGDNGFWASSNAKVTIADGVITADTTSVGDTVTITYVSSNGIVVTTVLSK